MTRNRMKNAMRCLAGMNLARNNAGYRSAGIGAPSGGDPLAEREAVVETAMQSEERLPALPVLSGENELLL